MSQFPSFPQNFKSASQSSETCLSANLPYLNHLLMRNDGYLNKLLYLAFHQLESMTTLEVLPTKDNKGTSSSMSSVSKDTTKNVSEPVSSKSIQAEECKNGVLTPTKVLNLDFISESDSSTPKNSSSKQRGGRRRPRNRKDVVFKTILRSVRRFYSKLFKSLYPKSFSKANPKHTIASQIEVVKNICEQLFPESQHIESTTYLVTCMVNHKLYESSVRIGLVPPKIKQQVHDLFECLYSFKMGKFKEVTSNKAVKELFTTMLSHGVDSIIQSEKAMAENPEMYLEAFDEIVKAR